jgi:EAL domain-containing protein (putative c-di-GMP-specific phosphodiesterase class I)
LATPEDAGLMAERLLSTLGEPVHHDEATIVPSASIGVASTNDLRLDATELVHDADLAVYRAKGSGRGRVEVCDEDLRASIAKRSEVEGALATAIADGELRLFFQPVIASPSNRVVSAEALVRWERPGHGLIQPDDFVPIAEEGNQILALDRWVLGQACRQLQEWSEDPLLSAIDIAVNLSGRHLADAGVVDDVLDPLRVAGLDPSKLVVEITESALLEDFDQAAHYLQRLREAGVRVALDDFGTGFTSLAHLRALPIDIIKIDRSFVADMAKAHDETLAQLIVNAGHLLDMTIVAEGVEDGEQLARLEAIGCEMIQGFYFSAPVPVHDFEILLREELFADR